MPYKINLCAFYVNEYNRKFICAAAGDGVHLQFSKSYQKSNIIHPKSDRTIVTFRWISHYYSIENISKV